MRFRTALGTAVLALIAALLATTSWGASTVLEDAAERSLTGDLVRSRSVLREIQSYRQSVLASKARVVAEEPRLKAVTTPGEVSRETIVGVAAELKKAIGSDLFILTDASGRLIADTEHPDESGHDLSGHELVSQGLKAGTASAVWTSERTTYQLQAQRLQFGEEVIGLLLIGYQIGDEFISSAHRQLGAALALELDGAFSAASELEGGARVNPDMARLAAALGKDAAPERIELGSETHMIATAAVDGYAGDRKLQFVLSRSVDLALAPAHRLSRLLYAISAVAMLVAIGMTIALSRRLSRPLDALVLFTERVRTGELKARAETSGPLEIQNVATAMNRMVEELERSRTELVVKERLEREMEIARRLQLSILPGEIDVPSLEISATMRPASEVGGDYYDVLPAVEGCWLGIGDVAGHGLPAGLIMLMIQSGVAGLVRARPNAKPSELVAELNQLLYENVRRRLKQDEHATLSLFHVRPTGHVRFAGAHEDFIVWRAAERRSEIVATQGTWLGARPDVAKVTRDDDLELAPGDILVLYTDGVTEAMNAAREQFGLERLVLTLEATAEQPVDKIRDQMLSEIDQFMAHQQDDVTLVVLRYVGAASSSSA